MMIKAPHYQDQNRLLLNGRGRALGGGTSYMTQPFKESIPSSFLCQQQKASPFFNRFWSFSNFLPWIKSKLWLLIERAQSTRKDFRENFSHRHFKCFPQNFKWAKFPLFALPKMELNFNSNLRATFARGRNGDAKKEGRKLRMNRFGDFRRNENENKIELMPRAEESTKNCSYWSAALSRSHET